ncbi:MAG: DUF998 domain-containing protein [Chloroflexi bacterium]|nr:DUF998 domain-containing protein [Chloroflexota bacterium]
MAYIAGFAGAVIMILGTLITGLAYIGPEGERYSPFNHYVSELGHTEDSELATLFNIALILSSLCLGVFKFGVALRFEGWFRRLLAVGAVVVGGFGLLVGVLPMNVSDAHFIVAAIFFITDMFYVAAFSVYVGFTGQNALPRWLAWAGIPMVLSSLVFLITALVDIARGENAMTQAASARADFLLITTTEWLVIIMLMVWVVIVSLHLRASE